MQRIGVDRMTKKEEKAIQMLEKFIAEHKFYNIKQSDNLEDNIETVLDLYKKQKEKNKELEEKDIASSKVIVEQCDYIQNKSISIEKIIKSIKILNKLEKQELKGTKGQDRYYIKQKYMYKRNSLQDLLESE